MSLTVERPFQICTSGRGRKTVGAREADPPPEPVSPAPVGRIPRITRLMALAIKFDGYLRDGVVADYAELARLGRVTRARITQIMDLNLLAPDIQEAILNLPPTEKGRDSIRERHVRQILVEMIWGRQRVMWHYGCTNLHPHRMKVIGRGSPDASVTKPHPTGTKPSPL